MGCGASSLEPSALAPASGVYSMPNNGDAGSSSSSGKQKGGRAVLAATRKYVESPAFAGPLSRWIDEHSVTFTEDSYTEALHRGGPSTDHVQVHADYVALTERMLKVGPPRFALAAASVPSCFPDVKTRFACCWQDFLRSASHCAHQ